jgi:ankyrin repeat protein
MLAAAWPAPATADIELFTSDRLIQAVTKSDYNAAESLLARGHNPDAYDGQRRTALQLAALSGDAEMVALLMKYRATARYKDPVGNTAMIYAANGGHTDAVAALIEGGANPNTANRRGLTALMIAARQGNLAMVQLLLEQKADASLRDHTGRSARMWAEWSNKSAVVRLFDRANIRE